MSELPKGWVKAKIKDVSIKCVQNKPNDEDKLVYVDIGSINRKLKVIENPQYLKGIDAPSRARKRINTNDVLVSLTRPNLNAIAHVPKDFDEQYASTGFEVIKSVDVDSRYLFALVKTHNFINAISGVVQGALYPAAKSSDVQNYEFPLAPLNEQVRIADKLDSVLAKVDAAQARLDKIPNILKRFRQSVLAAATSGELTKEWRINNKKVQFSSSEMKKEHEIFCLAKGKKYTKPESIPNDFNPFKIPDSWSWLRAEQFCDFITKGTTPKKDKMGKEFKIPYIKVYNLTFDGTLDFTINPTFIDQSVHEKELARSIVFPGDVLMNIVGPPLGKVSIVPNTYPEWNMNQAISVFRPICAVDNKYLSFCLQSNGLLDLVKMRAKATAGQFNLTLEICRDYPIPTPHISEQKEIVRRVESLFSMANIVEKQYKDAKARTNRLTQSILAKAFRGELVAQDENDEPASDLLKRINEAQMALKKATVKKTKAKQNVNA
jgi:type I restriction enzyme S subunit